MRTETVPVRWLLCGGAIVLGLGLVAFGAPALRAQAPRPGRWSTLPYTMPINPVHVALMNNGKVLIVSGSGNVATETNFQSAVLDLVTETITMFRGQSWDMFCNGMVTLARALSRSQ